MKNNFIFRPYFPLLTCLFAGLVSLSFPKMSVAEDMPAGISFQVFYDELAPYGDWISHPVHGYIWVPYAELGFQPYASNGYWVMTSYGNTWVSNYDWGWAPFHYGRWYFDDYVGWSWVPGYEWGPAWVNWRTGGDYYGWAPLMPGVSIHVAVNIPTNHWVFVPKRRLISRNIYNYYVPRRNVINVYNQTTVINNTYVYNNQTYVSGPARREVERVTRRSVPVYTVNNSDRPGRTSVSRNNLQVYQPAIRRTADNGEQTSRPSRVLSANEHKANIVSRTSNKGSTTRTAPVNSRTAPVNSRTATPRTAANRAAEEGGSEQHATRKVETRSAAPQRAADSPSRTRTSSPAQSTSAPARSQKEVITQPKQRTTTPTAPRQQSSPMTRGTQTPQQRTGGQVAPRQQNIQQPSRAARQEVSRSSNATRVSSAASAERSSGNSSRRSSQSRGASRGNN